MLIAAWEWVFGPDPGVLRLRSALRVTVSAAATLTMLLLLQHLLTIPYDAVGLGLMICIFAGVTVRDAGRPQQRLTIVLICVFLAFYAFQAAYGVMMFWITIMVALLYGLLGLLKPELLILRLEETAVGSAIGVAVMMSLLPVRSREALRGALGALAAALRELLARAADLLDDRGDAAALVGAAWQVAEKTQALHDAVGPLKRGWTILIARDAHGGPHRPALCLSCARSRPRRYGGRHSA